MATTPTVDEDRALAKYVPSVSIINIRKFQCFCHYHSPKQIHGGNSLKCALVFSASPNAFPCWLCMSCARVFVYLGGQIDDDV